ncbi:MAG: hypothetical protein IPK81_22150 [Rhodospirillales bacterium]|nr:MAG: hypothetical protein IPK81_22150 [Rhodospirillales bacterium]
MGHVVKEAGWCVIDIDTTQGTIFLQERWLYTWVVQPPLLPWTLQEKRNFHNNADRAIWAAWSNRAKLRATGTSGYARRFAGRDITINLDIRWVTANGHWSVTVTKIPPNQFATSSVLWPQRKITLDSNDTNVRTFVHGAGTPNTTQMPVAHEFGHAIGNSIHIGHEGDEYVDGKAHQADKTSIMNVGRSLRVRHFETIIDELNTMIPDTTFSVRAV